ncbi:hypothetical protein OUZ56_033631 [Daphnia magna]|uniref:Uncharacterized protein n=1 Tax=Daphnia magna TaxID=35525 RepID=A0ABQ9ZY34_9CRUS|nr:hypothetical protein OUZ56_033631 [Daphnia magna]
MHCVLDSSVACGSPSFTDCTFFCTHQTTTNFQTVCWLCSLLQLTSNHQLMFLKAPLTAFKYDSEVAGFWHGHNFQRCQLAAFPFAAPPNNHQLIICSLLFFCIHQTATNFNVLCFSQLCCLRFTILHRLHFFSHTSDNHQFSRVCWLRSLLQPPNNQQFIVFNCSVHCIATSFRQPPIILLV